MTLDQLHRARDLDTPSRDAMLRRDTSVQQFWYQHCDLLADAWREWEQSAERRSSVLDSSLLDGRLRAAVSEAWDDPTTESSVRELLHEAAPGVFSFQFFDPDRLHVLRTFLEDVWDAGIPLRPPYGIVLNRRGAMLDPRSEGCLGAPSFQVFYRELLDRYMRPISRVVFPEVVGFDTQTFGFTINYQPTTDTSIRPHSDASSVTLNINLNTPGEEYAGSSVDFFDPATRAVNVLTFEPGTAMIHRGNVPHMAQPITAGQRTNLVLWLYGDNGRTPVDTIESVVFDATERWTVPRAAPDHFAPF